VADVKQLKRRCDACIAEIHHPKYKTESKNCKAGLKRREGIIFPGESERRPQSRTLNMSRHVGKLATLLWHTNHNFGSININRLNHRKKHRIRVNCALEPNASSHSMGSNQTASRIHVFFDNGYAKHTRQIEPIIL
jgi:hypothetical protein